VREYAAMAVSLLFFAAMPVPAEFYRWVDKYGNEYYTNDPQKVPHEYRGRVETIIPDQSRVNIENKPATTRPGRVTSSAHRDKYGRGEEYWRKKAANLRLRLRDKEDEYNVVLKQLDEFNQGSETLNGEKRNSRSSLLNKKAMIEYDIAKIRRKLEVGLVEEARKADADPGWIRE
jgi:hypothetical protein